MLAVSAGGGLREQWLSNAFHKEAARCGGRLGPESAAKLAARLIMAKKDNKEGSVRAKPNMALEAAQERISQKLLVSTLRARDFQCTAKWNVYLV